LRVKTPQQAEKILTAAARLFATHRFHEARMDDIAALAEVGKGTLYRYFKDKDELYLALLDRAAEGLQSRLCQELRRASTPREQLVAVVEGLIDYFDAQPHVFDLIQHAEALRKPGAEFPWQKTRDKTMALVKDIFRAGQRAGVFKVADPDMAVLMLLGGLRAIIRFGKQPRPAGLAEEVVGRFLDGFGHADEPQIVDSTTSALHNA
jgi:TetR/AcrR family transcriptional regulator